MLTKYIVKSLSLTFIKNMSQSSAITVYIKINYLQYTFKLSLIIIIFFTVHIQTVIKMHRVFSAAFVNINLY